MADNHSNSFNNFALSIGGFVTYTYLRPSHYGGGIFTDETSQSKTSTSDTISSTTETSQSIISTSETGVTMVIMKKQ